MSAEGPRGQNIHTITDLLHGGRVAARSQKIDRQQLASLMRDCEDAIAGEPINARQSLALVARLREVERELGLRMRAREIRQAKEM